MKRIIILLVLIMMHMKQASTRFTDPKLQVLQEFKKKHRRPYGPKYPPDPETNHSIRQLKSKSQDGYWDIDKLLPKSLTLTPASTGPQIRRPNSLIGREAELPTSIQLSRPPIATLNMQQTYLLKSCNPHNPTDSRSCGGSHRGHSWR
jgi:hypothetical protein